MLTADHGVDSKHDANGNPEVVYVKDVLDDWLGTVAAQVILPITDPYVVHHGALDFHVTAYIPIGCDIGDITARFDASDGLMLVVGREEVLRQIEHSKKDRGITYLVDH